MKNFKNRWEIKENWQLLFPFLGIIGLLFSSYLLAGSFTGRVLKLSSTDDYHMMTVGLLTVFIFIPLLGLTLKIFKPLEKKWDVSYRWELIAIFIVFAVTGSTAAKISAPLLSFLNLYPDTTNGWIYWPLRILIIFPIYQILLLIVGWIFGQFQFFLNFEKKMLRRMGFSRFLKEP